MTTLPIDYQVLPTTVAVVGSRAFPRRDMLDQFVADIRPGTVLVNGITPGTPMDWISLKLTRRNAAHAQATAIPPYSPFTQPPLFPSPVLFRAAKERDGSVAEASWAIRDLRMLEWVKAEGGVVIAFGRIDPDTGRLTRECSQPVQIARSLEVPVFLVTVAVDGRVSFTTERFGDWLVRYPGSRSELLRG
jgi:hypothetical protein